MTLFGLKKTSRPLQCAALRCVGTANNLIPGDLWARNEVNLCDKHAQAALEFAEANPDYKPEAPLVKEGDYLAGVVVPDDWADNAYAVVKAVRESKAEADEVLEVARELVIRDQQDMVSAAEFLRDVKTKRNEIEAGEKSITAPLVAIVKRVRALVEPAKNAWTQAEGHLRKLVSDAALAESERNQQAVQAASDAHAQGQDVSEHLGKMTASGDLQGVSVTKVWVPVVDELSALPDEYVIRQPDLKKLKQYADSFEGKEPDPIAGVRFVQQAPLRVSGK